MTEKPLQQWLRYPNRFIRGRKLKSNLKIGDIPLGKGAIVDYNNRKIAVYKDESGGVFAYSAVCAHLGCIVGWNDKEKVWDCPCHGSRYDKEGKVIHGPASRNLTPQEIKIN